MLDTILHAQAFMDENHMKALIFNQSLENTNGFTKHDTFIYNYISEVCLNDLRCLEMCIVALILENTTIYQEK